MKMREVYIITDTHFNHEKIKEYCGRPDNFNELIWESLESLPADCMLIHLGDICWTNDKEVHERLAKLPYYKFLIRGNHDNKTDKWYLEHGWDDVANQITNHYFGRYITFSHIPVKDVQNWNIHGHLHNNSHHPEVDDYYNPNLHKLLAIEYTDYKAIKLEDFLKNII